MKIVAYGSYKHFNVCFSTVTMERGVYKDGEESGVIQLTFIILASEHPLKLEESAFA